MKKLNKKGFTLAELLVVVAIIAVLTAIAIPVFSAQLDKAEARTDLANIRAKYAEVVVGYLDDETTVASSTVTGVVEHGTATYDKTNKKITYAHESGKADLAGSIDVDTTVFSD